VSEHELDMRVRGMLQRGVVGAVDDSGDVQVATLATGDGVVRSSVEVHQPYGFASLPPDAQPLTMVLSVGADQGHQMGLQLWSAYRFGNLQPGEAVLWHYGGSRVHVKAAGNIDMLAAALLTVAAQNATITVAGTLTINGPVVFTGPVVFDAPVTFNEPVTFGGDVTIAGNLTVSGTITGTDSAGHPV
jgi:phage baseplate assembly protein V